VWSAAGPAISGATGDGFVEARRRAGVGVFGAVVVVVLVVAGATAASSARVRRLGRWVVCPLGSACAARRLASLYRS